MAYCHYVILLSSGQNGLNGAPSVFFHYHNEYVYKRKKVEFFNMLVNEGTVLGIQQPSFCALLDGGHKGTRYFK